MYSIKNLTWARLDSSDKLKNYTTMQIVIAQNYRMGYVIT